eukprot:g18614.t1
MRGSSVIKLLAACCGGLLVSIPVHAQKKVFDRRTGEDKGSSEDCVAAGYRYIEVEAFDYNLFPNITVNYTQIAGECGETSFAPYTESFVYDGTRGTKNGRRQMDMYICAPFGEYELQIEVRSTNGDGNPLAIVAWEIEYGPDQFHLWDTLNTPHFNTRNGATMADVPYAPIPPEYSGSGPGTIYKWPLPKSVGYYSTLYTGPFPPKHCPNRYPAGVAYEGCYPRQSEESGWTAPTQGPVGPTGKFGDRSETERMFDGLGIDDKGLEQDGVMTIENCERICKDEANGGPYLYMGLQSAVQCVCGNSIEGDHVENCGLEDDLKIPEYEFLCSGDSQVLCGTDTMVSIYSLGGGSTAPAPTPPAPTPPVPPTPSGADSYELLGCSVDNVPKGSRVMTYGPIKRDIMSAEICFDICTEVGYNTYFGTEYSVECFCATTADEVELLELEFGGCTMPCADPDVDPEEVADSDREKCGGENAISVYKIGGDGTGPAPTPPAPTPAAPSEPSGEGTCGPLGIEDDNGMVCCPLTCGACAGKGCRRRPGGPSDCCGGGIRDSDSYCSETGGMPPCIIGERPSGGGMCLDGTVGIEDDDAVVCCPLSCGECSGTGCSGRPGGSDDCCGGAIKKSGVMCSTSEKAPCVL